MGKPIRFGKGGQIRRVGKMRGRSYYHFQKRLDAIRSRLFEIKEELQRFPGNKELLEEQEQKKNELAILFRHMK